MSVCRWIYEQGFLFRDVKEFCMEYYFTSWMRGVEKTNDHRIFCDTCQGAASLPEEYRNASSFGRKSAEENGEVLDKSRANIAISWSLYYVTELFNLFLICIHAVHSIYRLITLILDVTAFEWLRMMWNTKGLYGKSCRNMSNEDFCASKQFFFPFMSVYTLKVTFKHQEQQDWLPWNGGSVKRTKDPAQRGSFSELVINGQKIPKLENLRGFRCSSAKYFYILLHRIFFN